MSFREYRHLMAEKVALEDTIAQLSPGASNALRAPLEHRLTRLVDRLETYGGAEPESDIGVVSVAGVPVVGARSIDMVMAGEVLTHFGRTVTALSGRKAEPVLTGFVPGSFGFQIEPGEPQGVLIGGVSPTSKAIEHVISAMAAVNSGNDEMVADAFVDFNSTALTSFRRFMSTLAENEAVCSVAIGTNSFGFSDVGRVRQVASLMESSVQESQDSWEGMFQGILPDRLWGEFITAGGSGSLIVRLALEEGSIPADLNDLLGIPVVVQVQTRRVRNSRPRFTVVSCDYSKEEEESRL